VFVASKLVVKVGCVVFVLTSEWDFICGVTQGWTIVRGQLQTYGQSSRTAWHTVTKSLLFMYLSTCNVFVTWETFVFALLEEIDLAGLIPQSLQLGTQVNLRETSWCHKPGPCTKSSAPRSVCFCSQSGWGRVKSPSYGTQMRQQPRARE
jgi:hypothetical protein